MLPDARCGVVGVRECVELVSSYSELIRLEPNRRKDAGSTVEGLYRFEKEHDGIETMGGGGDPGADVLSVLSRRATFSG